MYTLKSSTLACMLLLVPMAAAAQIADQAATVAEIRKDLVRINAGQCPDPVIGAVLPPAPDRSQEPLIIYARELDAGKVNQGQATGHVELFRGDQHMATENVLYNPQEETVTFPGPVRYKDQQLWMDGEEAFYSFQQESGHFSLIDYGLTGSSANGSAERAELEGGNTSTLYAIDYTTCPGEQPDWQLFARELTLKHEEGVGTARGAKLKFKNVPVFWWPYFSFPIDDRRKTGFLYPSFGQNSDSGTEFSIPFYWNIRPNHDMTLEPRYFTKRGTMLTAQYRFLTPRTSGQFDVDYLFRDKQTNEERYHYLFRHTAAPWKQWRTEVVVDRVSDNRFFQDFGTSLFTTSRQFLRSNATLSGVGRYWNFELMADDFQVIDESVGPLNEPYRRLPRIGFWMDRPTPIHGVHFELDTEVVNFDRDLGVTGARFDIYPRLVWDGRFRWGYIRPTAGFRYTGYDLDRHGQPGDESPQRGTGIASLDAGLVFERRKSNGGLQTLEPRAYYLYVPYEEQDDLPLFDTGEFTFGFGQLFNSNRFAGGDRQADANQLALAVSTHSYDANGQRKWSLNLGQLFYFDPLRVQLDGKPPVDNDLSPFIAEFNWHFWRRFEAVAGVHWDWDENRTDLANLGFRYTGDMGQRVAFEYRFRRDRVDQFDFRIFWPITESWRILSRVNYSFADEDLLEVQGGVEYESCCWAIRTVLRRYLKNRDGEYRDAIYVEINLKGLASIGTRGRELFP